MADGIATITQLLDRQHEIYPQLEQRTRHLAEGVAALAAQAGIPLALNRCGSMWTWFFQAGPVTDYASAARSNTTAFAAFHRAMMEQGVWLPPSQFEAAFLSAAHGAPEIEATLTAAGCAFAAVQNATPTSPA
jgi:glutamate-1-semialdehyde 2,1-aminomutase